MRAELRHQVSLAYLLFRIADTIEDSTWPDLQQQKNAFQQFLGFISEPATAEQIKNYTQLFPTTVPDEEKILLNDLTILLQDLHDLPVEALVPLRQSLTDMIKGMQHFATPDNARVKTMAELNQYCFFVAGLVGELLTELALKRRLSLPNDEAVLLNSHHFGLFLQKINILKDQSKDENEGRHFVPDRQLIWESLKENSDHGFSYISQLPSTLRDYKLFCAYSFFLGLFSLSYIENSWLSKMATRIPRAIVTAFLAQVENKIDDNTALEEIYLKYKNKLASPTLFVDLKTIQLEPLQWFKQSYSRTLPMMHLKSLGII
ncbi:MAG: squalene/phytoene synthase family protein [Bdellovibrio sp.]|nr:squalene/phytoene synthase family protein [Bdellovibrio sp.]